MSKEDANNQQTVNLLDFVLTAFRYKGRIFSIVFLITLVALITSLVWPQTYKSSVKFAQYSTAPGGGISGLLGNFMQMPYTTDRVSAEQALVILRSRSMQDMVIEEFDLHEVYGIDVREYVREELSNNTVIEEVREGGIGFSPIVSIELSFLDRDPERAKEIAEYYMVKLDSVMTEINRSNTQILMNIFERRFRESRRDMAAAEEAFLEFQREHGILELESQLSKMIENLGDVKANLVALDVQLNVARATMSSEASQVRQLETRQRELDSVYRDMIRRTELQAREGEVFSEEGEVEDIFPPLMNMPELGIQYMRLYREMMVQEKIFELVYPQYEQQRLLLEESSSGLQTIDEAVLPTYKDSPSRALITIAGFIFSIFVAFFSVYFSEFVRKGSEENSENYQKYLELRKQLAFNKD